MKTIKHKLAALMALVMCVSLLLVPAYAHVRVDTEARASLELSYVDADRNTPIAGMSLRIYQVMDMSEAVRFTPTEAFRRYESVVNFDMAEMEHQSDWRELASTLSGLVARDGAPEPTRAGKTDEAGVVRFEDLPVGLYLVVGDRVRIGRYSYTPQAFLMALPNLVEDEWDYEVEAKGKYSRKYHVNKDKTEYTSRNVLKEWKDAGVEGRPGSVTVELLQDGKVYDTVLLQESNNWRHSWTKLSDEYDWTVVETNIPEGYTVSITQQGNTFVVTNTAGEEPPTDPPTDPPVDPPVEPPVDPPVEPPVDPPVDPPEQELPQTGTLWWPVPLLITAGLALFTMGFALNRRKGRG